ncbi:MAG: sialate O-acetylesterase [Planctomycetaceae bacterium]
MRASALVLLPLLAAAAAADVRLPGLFGEGMVLQRDTKLDVWGWADAGETVTVELAGESATVVAGKDGRWSATLGPFAAAADLTLTVAGRNRLEIANVAMGEVWICSGQSNMQWPVSASEGAGEATGTDPRLRLFTVPVRAADAPATDVQGRWSAVDETSVPGFSAVAYWFGRRLREDLGVPVGLIQSCLGGTPAEAWTSREALASDPLLQPILASWAEGAAGRNPAHRPAGLFDGMIAPLAPYAMRGVLWYQGESNASRAEQYRVLFPALIRDWRRTWGRGDFPFLFVQLANFGARAAAPGESAWAELREAQRLALELPHTGMAVAIDIGDAKDIHPRNKREVARRLHLVARDVAYGGEGMVCSGPRYWDHQVEEDRIVVRLRDAGGGLRASDGLALRGFAVAGEDRVWRWAEARIDGFSVEVSHPELSRPLAVRYAWADNPDGNLGNAEGLPASPFRTDDWPLSTAGRR